MKKTMKYANNRIVKFLMIMALGVLTMSGCQQVNDMVNKPANTNTATNSNASANANANSNANSNTTANSNANANTSASPTNSAANSNTSASNTAANTATTTKEEVPLTPEAKVFKNKLMGSWTNGTEIDTFTENTVEFKRKSEDKPYNTSSYRVINENTFEATGSDGRPWKAEISFEDNGDTLIWHNLDNGAKSKMKRVK